MPPEDNRTLTMVVNSIFNSAPPTLLREEFLHTAVNGLGYSGTEVARYLGVTNSCVTRIVAQRRWWEG